MGTVMLIVQHDTLRRLELGNKGRIVCDIDAKEDCKLIQTAASGRRRTATAKLSLERELVVEHSLRNPPENKIPIQCEGTKVATLKSSSKES
jgi:hypothetical protein